MTKRKPSADFGISLSSKSSHVTDPARDRSLQSVSSTKPFKDFSYGLVLVCFSFVFSFPHTRDSKGSGYDNKPEDIPVFLSINTITIKDRFRYIKLIQLGSEALRTQTKENWMTMFIGFFCLCPLGLTIKLNFNISKVASDRPRRICCSCSSERGD